jgi:uncharacterized protein YaiI (UPF0178 family)
MPLNLWLDADACPVDIKDIMFRVSRRFGLRLTLVANCSLRVPGDELITSVVVPNGADMADNYIAEQCAENDLVVTADIPLAARIVEKGAVGLNPRGELYTEENVGQCLSMRNFMEEMRSGGMVEGGPAPHSNSDNQKFANALDCYLTRRVRELKRQ